MSGPPDAKNTLSNYARSFSRSERESRRGENVLPNFFSETFSSFSSRPQKKTLQTIW